MKIMYGNFYTQEKKRKYHAFCWNHIFLYSQFSSEKTNPG